MTAIILHFAFSILHFSLRLGAAGLLKPEAPTKEPNANCRFRSLAREASMRAATVAWSMRLVF
jgi:hypothetical protein